MKVKNTWFVAVGVVLAVAVIVLWGSQKVGAAISQFFPSDCYTAAATTTLNFMTPGTATTTLACNMGGEGAKEAVVVAQVHASSTATEYLFGIEESMDGIDWYPISAQQIASSSPIFSLYDKGTVRYTYASTTIGGVAEAENALNGSRNNISFSVPTRMSRVRVFVGLASSTNAVPARSNGAIWMKIIPR